MKKSTIESLSSFPSSKVSRSICKTVTLGNAGGGGNTATTLIKRIKKEGKQIKLSEVQSV